MSCSMHLHQQHCAALPADRARVILTFIRLRLHTDSHGAFCNKQVLMSCWTLWSWNRASVCWVMPRGLKAVSNTCKGETDLQHPKWTFIGILLNLRPSGSKSSPKLEEINLKETGLNGVRHWTFFNCKYNFYRDIFCVAEDLTTGVTWGQRGYSFTLQGQRAWLFTLQGQRDWLFTLQGHGDWLFTLQGLWDWLFTLQLQRAWLFTLQGQRDWLFTLQGQRDWLFTLQWQRDWLFTLHGQRDWLFTLHGQRDWLFTLQGQRD